ncbi:glycosyltransferase [Candidatus Actinomarina]|nr:glycosyltransferase [Candidatus Actinomarina sp.]
MKKLLNEISLIIPSKNDHLRIEENIEEITNFLSENIDYYEILIISNGSSKESIIYLESLLKKHQNINHTIINKSGKGLAIRNGLAFTKYDNVLFSDADSSVKITELIKFVSDGKLISGFVTGNRKNKTSENINSPILRRISGSIYLYIIKYLFNLSFEDTQCGFKAIDKKVFSNCNTFVTDGYSFDLELFLLAQEMGVNIKQVPVKYTHNSESKVRIFKDTFKMLIDIKRIYKNK